MRTKDKMLLEELVKKIIVMNSGATPIIFDMYSDEFSSLLQQIEHKINMFMDHIQVEGEEND